MLYWTNWNIERPSIERSHLNGSYREVIVQNGLFMPHGLGLDVSQQMIYWANNLRHGTFQIERSLVDGSERQLIYEGKGHELRGQFIFGLTARDSHQLIFITNNHSRLNPIRLENIIFIGLIGIKRPYGLCQKEDPPKGHKHFVVINRNQWLSSYCRISH